MPITTCYLVLHLLYSGFLGGGEVVVFGEHPMDGRHVMENLHEDNKHKVSYSALFHLDKIQ